MASIWDTLFPKQDYRTAAPAGGYADLYANGLLGNRTDTPTSVGAMETGKDFIPVLSDVLAFGEAGHALSEGDRKTAAILAAGGLLGTIPGLGPTLARPVMAAGRKAADVASRIEVDPSAVGSLLGNVRMKPKSPAEEIAGLLSSGRADDVTDEMLSKLTAQDNSELFDLYQSGATGMDLPMDEASRMARAEAAGFDVNKSLYHGTNSDINGFSGNVFSSDNPTLASTYNKGLEGAGIYPIMTKSKLGDTLVEGGGAGWSQLNVSDVKDPAVAEWLDWAEGQKISTREIETAASREGRSGVQFEDIVDTGAGFNSNKFKNLGYTKEQERALQKQYMEDLSKPSNVDVRLSPNLVRSRFARFDPRLAHLKNLSAGVGVAPIGLLALREEQKRANEEQYKRGLLQ